MVDLFVEIIHNLIFVKTHRCCVFLLVPLRAWCDLKFDITGPEQDQDGLFHTHQDVNNLPCQGPRQQRQ